MSCRGVCFFELKRFALLIGPGTSSPAMTCVWVFRDYVQLSSVLRWEIINKPAQLLQEVIAEACQSTHRRHLEKILREARKEGRFGQTSNDDAAMERPYEVMLENHADLAMAEESEPVSIFRGPAESIGMLPTSLAPTCVDNMAETLHRPHVTVGMPGGDDDCGGEGMEVG